MSFDHLPTNTIKQGTSTSQATIDIAISVHEVHMISLEQVLHPLGQPIIIRGLKI